MFFVDKPYISDFLKKTIKENDIPIVGTDTAKKLDLYKGTNIISENKAIELIKKSDYPVIYTTSENSLGWISDNLSFTDLPLKIALFKNKVKFRKLTEKMFPDFYYKEVQLVDLKTIQFDDLPLPFIIKPSIGFFSMGVHKVSNSQEWRQTIDLIYKEMDSVKNLYPKEVLNTGSFIIEQCINGEEFAVDAYYNSEGEAVILSILKHTFSSDSDVSDRVYTSSKDILQNNLEVFSGFAQKIGGLAGVKNFPVHIELRRESNGTLLPIEVNPMRFGGWCSTSDLSFLAYGFNPYLYYYKQEKPDWEKLLQGKDKKLFNIIVLDNSTGLTADRIKSFNYEKLMDTFEKPLELRKIDYKQYPVFGFLFTETREDNFIELKNILDSDLKEFVSVVE